MNLLQILKQPKSVTSESKENEVQSSYRYWRWRIFFGMYIGYVFYYFSRNSYASIKPLLLQEGFALSDLGILVSIFAIAYGSSKFLSGILSDRSNPRIFMSVGLVITGILNILFGYSSSLLMMAVVWGLNGLFQGWGWPACAKLLTHWYSQKERGTWWGMQNSSHNVGSNLSRFLVVLAAQAFGWRYGMYAVGVVTIGMGILIFFILRDTPSTLGLPSIEKFKKEDDLRQEKEITLKDLLFKYVLNNAYLWVLGISYFFVYLIRGAITEWCPKFLMETRGYELVTASNTVIWFDIGGLLGGFTAGWLSDKIFRGKRGPINILFSLFVTGAIMALCLLPPTTIAVDYFLIFIIGFLIFGPQMLIGMMAVELSHKKAAGAATGFIGLIAYLGWAGAGYPLTKIMEWFGWSGFFATLTICGAASVLLLLPFWAIKSNPKYATPEEEPVKTVS